MLTSGKTKKPDVQTALRRMREASGLTMRQASALVGISHVAISQFENKKLNLPDSRVEGLVRAYGYSAADLEKLLGKAPITTPRDDCRAMIERLTDDQLSAVRSVMFQILNSTEVIASEVTK